MSLPRQPAPKPRPSASFDARQQAGGVRRVPDHRRRTEAQRGDDERGASGDPSRVEHVASFDFDIDIDADGALELDSRPSAQLTRAETSRLPTSQDAPPAPAPMPMPLPRRSSSTTMAAVNPPRRSSATTAAVDPHDALVAFSGFGVPPVSIFGAPPYAARVILRRRTLRRELALARLRHSQDVGIYEASLRTADDVAVRNGILVTLVFFTMMTLLAWTVLRVLTGSLVVPW